MSIYPRFVKLGDSVNIHVGVIVKDIAFEKIDAKIIIEINSDLSRTSFFQKVILERNKEANYYFKFKSYDVGKHEVCVFIDIGGKKIESENKETDFFHVGENNKSIFDLSDYLKFCDPNESYEDLLFDSKQIIEGKKELKTTIAKKFLLKSRKNFLESKRFFNQN